MLFWLVLVALSILSLTRESARVEKFFYFAYGSNLLKERILIKNPSSVFYAPAKLTGYRLDFNMQVKMWNGAVATIVPDTEGIVWGNLWLMDSDKVENLDKQEGVDQGWYYAKNVTVETKDGHGIVARTYIETQNPPKLIPTQALPHKRRPSDTYLKVMTVGALRNDLPDYYVDYLRTFLTNRKKAPRETLRSMGWDTSENY